MEKGIEEGWGGTEGGLEAQGSPHLGDVHIGRVAPHGAVGLPITRVADQLRIPDAEIAASRSPRGEDGDGGPGESGEGRQDTLRPRGSGGGRGDSHRMLPRLVANWMWEQRRLNISPSPAQSRASNTCGGTARAVGHLCGNLQARGSLGRRDKAGSPQNTGHGMRVPVAWG